MTNSTIYVVYDKACPMCHHYCKMVRLREAAGQLVLIDARQSSELMTEITNRGLDIDQGMVVKINQQIYYGCEAIHVLALMTSPIGWFNRLSCWLFGRQSVAKVLYPLLRGCRNVVLKILGIRKINNLNIEGNDKF